jgi:hypothetical protein
LGTSSVPAERPDDPIAMESAPYIGRAIPLVDVLTPIHRVFRKLRSRCESEIALAFACEAIGGPVRVFEIGTGRRHLSARSLAHRALRAPSIRKDLTMG